MPGTIPNNLLFDCQILQTEAFDRGMGKYTLSLIQSVVQKAQHNTHIHIIFNKNLDISNERIGKVKDILPHVPIHLLDLPVDISSDMEKKNKKAVEAFSELIDRHFKSSKSDTAFIITAPFFVRFSSVFPKQRFVKKIAIVYDFIPVKIWSTQKIFLDDIYLPHLNTLITADHLLTISNAVKLDLIEIFGFSEKSISNINGAAFSRPSSDENIIKKLQMPYILMPSGPIIHKNNSRAVKAFSVFNKNYNDRYTLYITSAFDEKTVKELTNLSNKVVFLGNVSDEELFALYENAEVVFFPSLAEGLGMPILEAVDSDVPVACSKIPVLTEISEEAFYQFDPLIVGSIANKLDSAVKQKNWSIKHPHYSEVLKKYTWSNSARSLIKAIQNTELSKPLGSKASLLIYMESPSSGAPSSIIGEKIYTILSKKFDIIVRSRPTKRTQRPSFVEHIGNNFDSPEPITNMIKIKNVPKASFRKKRLTVIANSKDFGKKTFTMNIRKKVLDKSFGLETWVFVNSKGDEISHIQLCDSIEDFLAGGNP